MDNSHDTIDIWGFYLTVEPRNQVELLGGTKVYIDWSAVVPSTR